MSEIDDNTEPLETPQEAVDLDEVTDNGNPNETERISKSKDPTDLGEDISADELGIDLESLKLSTPNVLGKAKPKPSLATNSTESSRSVGRPAREDEGLFAWCEQFAYTPGVDYLKLHRLYPKTWEGMSIGGFIEEVYEPIDEHWLADRWGGGSYQIEAYQRDSTGRSRKTQVKHVEISGLPKSYMGSDGRPHVLPSAHISQSHSSRRSADVLRRRMGLGRFRNRSNENFDDDFDAEDVESIPRPRPQAPKPSNIDQPLADAGALYKVLQENKKSENDALGVLREAQKDVHTQMQATAQQQAEMYRAMLDQQKEEMRRVREESKAAAENSSAPFKELLQFMTLQGSDTSSKTNLEALRAAHDSAIQSLTREHASHIDNLRKTFESRQSDLSDELNRLRATYAQDVERIRQDYLEKEKSSKDDAFRNYQTQLQLVQAQSADLRERHRDELASVTREKNDLIASLRQDLSELRTSSLTKDHEARMALIERENSLKQEAQARERQLIDRINTLETNYSKTSSEREASLRVEFQERERQLQDRINSLENNYSKTSSEREEALRKDFLTREADLKEKLLRLESLGKTTILEERQRMKEEFEEKFEAKFEALKSSYEAKLESLKESTDLKVASAEKESKSSVDAIKKEVRAQYESQIAKLEATIESLKSEYTAREQLSLERAKMEQASAQKERENQRLILESTAQSREALAEMSRKQLESKVRELTKEVELAKRERDMFAEQSLPESNDPFEQLEKLNAIKERLKLHGFIDSSEKEKDKDDEVAETEEEKPKNFLDKVLQYGPQFVGPILQRIDAATAVAQQAVNQQQQQETLKSRDEVIQQQRLIEQERQAAVDREQALRERREMLLQRRAEREQELAMEAAQREQVAQQMAQERVTNLDEPQTQAIIEPQQPLTETETFESPQQAESSEEDMSDKDGYTQLAEYLDGCISAKKKPEAIVGEIKMALMMGMFSKDVLNEVLAVEFDDLVERLSAVKPSLKTPKARVTLKAVMDGVRK